VQLLEEVAYVLVARGQDDEFLPYVGPLPHFAGGAEVHAGLLGVEVEDVARLELDGPAQLVRGDHREAEVLHVHDLAREGGDDLAADEPAAPQHRADHVHRHRQPQVRLCADLLRERLPRRGDDGKRLTHDLELQHLDAVKPDVEADRLNL
jgi:hypothetical protein